ncbi:MAG: phage terminase large subunit family protein [Candidatus Adiutrix sp.]|jgi:phage terminase large subunit GpA-like protein|nr:phage terminase large subunit family protein [Candidatus Adiutrix sp.]
MTSLFDPRHIERAPVAAALPAVPEGYAGPVFRFTAGERHIFRQRERISVSQWAARNIIVQDGPYRGARMRLDVAPYLAEIMDAWGQDGVEAVAVCGAPQTGKTLALYAALGYAIDRRPATKMLAMPDDNVLRRVETEKLKPLLEASPLLKSLCGKMTSGHIRLKDGSSLFLSSSQSPSQRASITVQDLFLDEEDLYQTLAGKGDPVEDFVERTRSYSHSRKIMRVSKPVGDASSSIWRAVTRDMDMCLAYEAVCPSCHQGQFMVPEGVVALKVNHSGQETAPTAREIVRDKLGRYKCRHCGALWNDALRDLAVSRGRWKPVSLDEEKSAPRFSPAPEIPRARRLGFWLPAVLSRAVSLSEAAAGEVKAEEEVDPEKKQAHVNGLWAMPYSAATVEPDEAVILSRRDFSLPARTVPHGAVALTCGIDTQKVGFYYLVEAWMPNMNRYVIDYGRLAEFDDVNRLIWESAYPVLGPDEKPSGQHLDIWRAAIDTGGTTADGVYTRTEEVYEHVRMYGHEKLHAAKGASREQSSAVRWSTLDRLPQRQTRIPGGLMLYSVDTAKIKEKIFLLLMDTEARRSIGLYGYDPARENQDGLHDDLAAQLCAERQVRTASGKKVWEQIRKDNHYLDCLMLAEACGDVSWTPSIDHLIKYLEAETQAAAAAPAPERRREFSCKRRSSKW